MGFADSFRQNFIEDDRWKYLADGLKTTLIITFFAVLLGLVLGFLVAIIRSTYLRTKKLLIPDILCRIYLTVIRGTPVVVQLLIIYFVIFASVPISKTLVAIIAFGVNSGAYVAEIVRGGIMAIDAGQLEAGRSLGLNYRQTMTSIILPQAFKNILPALGNEFISLVKETSVISVIAVNDLMKMAGYVGSRTWDVIPPYVIAAAIYLLMTLGLTRLMGTFERRMAKSDRH